MPTTPTTEMYEFYMTRGLTGMFAGIPIRTIPEVRKIYFNNMHTTIEWADGEKTTVGCMEGQEFDEYSGFAAAVLKRLFGSSKAAVRYMDERKVVQPEKVKKVKQTPMQPIEGNDCVTLATVDDK